MGQIKNIKLHIVTDIKKPQIHPTNNNRSASTMARKRGVKKNPLKNDAVMFRLNPFKKTTKKCSERCCCKETVNVLDMNLGRMQLGVDEVMGNDLVGGDWLKLKMKMGSGSLCVIFNYGNNL